MSDIDETQDSDRTATLSVELENERQRLRGRNARFRVLAIIGLVVLVGGALGFALLPSGFGFLILMFGVITAGAGFVLSLENERKLRLNLREIWDDHADVQLRYKGLNRP